MRALGLVLGGVLCAGCAGLPVLPPRPDFAHDPGIRDSADKLATYYNWRVTPGDGGYHYGRFVIPLRQMPAFMDLQGDTVAASWAREGNRVVVVGWLGALSLEAAAITVGAQGGAGDPVRNAWWMGLLPSAILGWTFHWIGDNYFRKPAVAHYDLQLKRELELTPD